MMTGPVDIQMILDFLRTKNSLVTRHSATVHSKKKCVFSNATSHLLQVGSIYVSNDVGIHFDYLLQITFLPNGSQSHWICNLLLIACSMKNVQ